MEVPARDSTLREVSRLGECMIPDVFVLPGTENESRLTKQEVDMIGPLCYDQHNPISNFPCYFWWRHWTYYGMRVYQDERSRG
jgi:hypothetical protein